MLARRLLAFFGLLLGPATALAQEPVSAPSVLTPVDDEDPLPPLVPRAHDTLGGHVQVGATGLVTAPIGELQNGYGARDLGAGFGVALDAGVGVSRSLVIGVWGEGLWYSNGAACRFWHLPAAPRDPCGATSFSVGPFVRYHLLQGMRFDPWLVVGPGYRAIRQETPDGTKKYGGIEWLHAVLGADYYVTSGFGFGPWLGIDGGVFTTRPTPLCSADRCGGIAKTAWHTEFTFGLRLVLDIPGK
jgi:hypothetical protein